MKKIIYALVIMIAASSLFTSCIEPVEPEGILALREAKARYYDALAKLREADAEFRRAEAAVQQAEAAYKQAYTDAFTKMQALEREAKEIANELARIKNAEEELELEWKTAELAAKLDSLEKAMELAQKQHEIDLVDYQKKLANHEEALRLALRKIELAAQDLTQEEKECVIAAAKVYWDLYKKVSALEIKVMKAENTLANAQRAAELAKNNPDMAWDSETHSYISKIDSANNAIARYEKFIAEDNEILENVPAFDDLEEWGDELAGYKKAMEELKYGRYTLTQDAAAYYVNNVHDGIKTFNDAINKFCEDNDEIADPGDEPAEPQQSQYKTNTKLDSLQIKKLEVDKNDKGFTIYKRFADLVGELDDLPKPVAKNYKDTTGKIATVNTTENPYTAWISAVTGIKTLVFGDEAKWMKGDPTKVTYKIFSKNDKGEWVTKDTTVTVKYGIDGAVSVLERELVLAETALDEEALKDAYEKAENKWKEDRKVLEDGLAKWSKYKDAKHKLDSIKAADKTEGDAMVNAIKALQEGLAKINAASLSNPDSVQVITVFKDFAVAREAYLDYYDVNGKDGNKLWYHYAKAKEGSGDIVNDSIEFTKLSYDLLKKNGWGVPVDKDPTVNTNRYEDPEPNYALGHIASQLLGDDWGQAIAKAPGLSGWTLPTTLTKDAFYGQYEYDPVKKTMKRLAIGAPYNLPEEDPFVTKEKKEAEKAVQDAIDEYVAIYEAYWHGVTYPATLTKDSDAAAIEAARKNEILVGIYNEKTFTDPYTIVSFVEGDILYNDGLGTILAFIDPKVKKANAWDYRNGVNVIENTIFGKKGDFTTYGEYLKAKQAYEDRGALEPYKVALQAIKDWVKAAKDVFKAAEDGDGKDDTTAYNNAHSSWETKHKAWETNTEKYGKYTAAFNAFVGVDEEDKPLVADQAALKAMKIADSYKEGVDKIFKVEPLAYGFPLIDTKEWDWIETLGGELKTLAEECFPEFPTTMKGWKEEVDEINDKIAHNDILTKALDPVYMASIEVIKHNKYPEWKRAHDDKGEVSETDKPLVGTDILSLVEKYKEAREKYIKDVNEDIEYWEGEKDKALKFIADFESGVPVYQIEVEQAQADLDLAKKELVLYTELLKGAKENLERIIEYLVSQDVNFINLNGVTIPDFTTTTTTTTK